MIHHLNCGSLFPFYPKVESIVYCLLVETNKGPVLIDTGFGRDDYSNPSAKMRFFLPLMGVPRQTSETAIEQVSTLGFDPGDVRHIVLTHLHLDHAGGLADFPRSSVHVYRDEYLAAMKPSGLMDFGYDAAHWAHQPNWELRMDPQETWYGFPCIPAIEGIEPRIFLIPLPGHTRGHCAVAIETQDGWLLHCGDAASPFHGQTDLHNRKPDAYPLDFLPGWVAGRVIGPHIHRLRALLEEHGDVVRAISAHDIFSFREIMAAEPGPGRERDT
jgi:glyoxylase-like metal-dependent hydrolase (beta-lactamase superfamily II)